MVRPTKRHVGGGNKRFSSWVWVSQNKTLVKPWTQNCIAICRRETEMFGRGMVWSVLKRGKEACRIHKLCLRGTPFSSSSTQPPPFKFLTPPVATHYIHAFRSQLFPKVTSLSHLGTLQFSIFIPFKLVWSYGSSSVPLLFIYSQSLPAILLFFLNPSLSLMMLLCECEWLVSYEEMMLFI